MKIRLNLATLPLENNRRFLLGYGVVGGLALLALIVLGAKAYQSWSANYSVRSESARLSNEIQRFKEQRTELEKFFKQDDTHKIMDRAAFLNSLIEQRSFPWTRMFTDLERLLPQGVRVISAAPRLEGSRVELKLSVGALSDEAKLKFLESLEKSPVFERVQVIAETRPKTTEEGDRVVVDLAAYYDSTARTESSPVKAIPKARGKREQGDE